MPTRSNALSELTRFWLEARHGCLVMESVPVPVPYALSDIDLMAQRPDLAAIALPNGLPIGPRIIVETKDEHDWEPSGREFAGMLRADLGRMGDQPFVPRKARGVKFTMLREEHFDKAREMWGTDDFDRLFVVHALSSEVLEELAPLLSSRRIYWLTARELLGDLLGWYRAHPRPAGLRNSLVGDMLHLLVGFCGLGVKSDHLDRK